MAPALVGAACRLAEQDLPGCEAGLWRADAYPGPDSGPAARLARAFVGVLAGRLADDLTATERAAADVERVLPELPPHLLAERPEIRALVLAGLGAAELGAGHPDRAVSVLTSAVEVCGKPGTEYPLCDALGSLALAELMRGRLRQAAAHARASLAVAEQYALPTGRRTGAGHLALAGVAVEQDDLAAARRHLDLASSEAGPRPEPVAAVLAAVTGAGIAAAEGDAEAALTTLRMLRTAGAPVRLHSWAVAGLAVAESTAQLARGDAVAALQVLDAVEGAEGEDGDRPEQVLAGARALLASGRGDRAAEVLAGIAGGRGRRRRRYGHGRACSRRRSLRRTATPTRPDGGWGRRWGSPGRRACAGCSRRAVPGCAGSCAGTRSWPGCTAGCTPAPRYVRRRRRRR